MKLKKIKWFFSSIVIVTLLVSIYIVASTLTNSTNKLNVKVQNDSNKEILNIKDIVNSNGNISLEEEYDFLGELPDGRPWFINILSDENVLYGYSGYDTENKLDIISYDLNTKTYNVLSTVDDNITPVFFDSNESYVAWIENSSLDNINKSTIRLLDQKTKEISTIVEADIINSLSLTNNTIYWTSYEAEDNRYCSIINQYNIITDENKLYRKNAYSPVVNDTFIAFLEENEKNGETSLFINYFENDLIYEVDGVDKITEITGYDDTLLLVYSVDGKDTIATLENNKLTNLLTSNDSFNYPKINDKFICWNTSTQSKIYDRSNNQIILLDDEDININTLFNNNYIVTSKHSTKKNIDKEDAINIGMFYGHFNIKKLK